MSQPGGGGSGRSLSSKSDPMSKKSPGGGGEGARGAAGKGGYRSSLSVGYGGKAKVIPQIGDSLKSA